MTVYDTANELGRELKNSREYIEYKEMKDKVYANPKLKEKIEEFEKIRYETQLMAIQGEEQNQEKMQKLQELYTILLDNKDVGFTIVISEYALPSSGVITILPELKSNDSNVKGSPSAPDLLLRTLGTNVENVSFEEACTPIVLRFFAKSFLTLTNLVKYSAIINPP